jgi:enoyl-CoA hydratase/3-hydroxyacyl-CoA dehydrogenase
MGPFFLADLLGLDTVLHVAEHLDASYPGRMYVHQGLRARVAEGKLGAKTGGEGFYRDGEPQVPGDAEPDVEELADRFNLRALVECLALVEEGVCSTREIDLGMMAGTGLAPPPLARADAAGLDAVLERLERAAQGWGERFAPPPLLRRLVAQGRTGPPAGQGVFAYKRPDEGFGQPETLGLETRDDIAIVWLDNPPANSISAQLVADLARVWEHIRDGGTVRALILASANPQLFCAGADIKGFTAQMESGAGAGFARRMHGLVRDLERSGVVTIAAVNGLAVGGGCELAMGCDIRIAAQSARFGQPEISLGIMPGFGGTQRLPRLVGASKALELNLTGEPIGADEAYELGLVNRVVPDHELLDAALAWARKLAMQAPQAVRAIKEVSAGDALDAGLQAEQRAFVEVFATDDAREGVAAFLEKRQARWRGT